MCQLQKVLWQGTGFAKVDGCKGKISKETYKEVILKTCYLKIGNDGIQHRTLELH